MLSNRQIAVLRIGLIALAAMALGVGAEETDHGEQGHDQRSKRERMYDRYLEFPSLIRGGSVTPRWLDDGTSFTYVEGDGAEAVIYDWRLTDDSSRNI